MNECDMCGAEVDGTTHTCPFREDIDGDYETECNCCSNCESNCCQDI